MEILTHMNSSIGLALIDSLDELVHSGRIEPQLAMKVIATFDKSITEVLADKVKTRLNFKVRASCEYCKAEKEKKNFYPSLLMHSCVARVTWTPIDSAMKFGPSLSKMSASSSTIRTLCRPIESKSSAATQSDREKHERQRGSEPFSPSPPTKA